MVTATPLCGGVRVGEERHLVEEVVSHEEHEVRAAHQPADTRQQQQQALAFGERGIQQYVYIYYSRFPSRTWLT